MSKAIIYRKYGKSDVLKLEDVTLSSLKQDEVRLKVHAAGVNPVDWKIRKGLLRWLPIYRLPIMPGMDVSGVVDEMGGKVKNLQKGDRVFGFVNTRGCYAEAVNAKSDFLIKIPNKMSFEEAAGLSLAGLTALQSLKLGKIKAGDKVLITGAAGGVGYFAVQMAISLGAEVTAVCRKQNFPLIEHLGCERLVDNETEDWTKLEDQFDIVFDAAAHHSFGQCMKIMKKRSTMISTMPTNKFLLFKPLSWLLGKKLYFIMIHSDRNDLQFMIDLYEKGKLHVNVEQVYPLEKAADAMDKSEFGRVRGKIVIKVR
jgi:NADPH:quinone reductase-like Zn-dependent oxidoreductase